MRCDRRDENVDYFLLTFENVENYKQLNYHVRSISLNIKHLITLENETFVQLSRNCDRNKFNMQSLTVRGATKSFRSEKKDHLILNELNLNVDVGSM